MDRRTCLIGLLSVLAAPASAAPVRYRLDPAASQVTFGYVLAGQRAEGTMPITRADLALDFRAVDRSSARVSLDADGTRTGVIFVTETLKGPEMLDTGRHPQIDFVSRRIAGSVNGATITGDVTIRGVTRPITLAAEIFRRRGSAEGDLSRLTVLLTGALDRHDFGASGYRNLVAPTVDLRILARLSRVDG